MPWLMRVERFRCRRVWGSSGYWGILNPKRERRSWDSGLRGKVLFGIQVLIVRQSLVYRV